MLVAIKLAVHEVLVNNKSIDKLLLEDEEGEPQPIYVNVPLLHLERGNDKQHPVMQVNTLVRDEHMTIGLMEEIELEKVRFVTFGRVKPTTTVGVVCRVEQEIHPASTLAVP